MLTRKARDRAGDENKNERSDTIPKIVGAFVLLTYSAQIT